MQDIWHKPTSIKNPQANAILKCIHAVFTNMLHTAKLNMAESVNASDIDIFLADAAWAICSTHHTVLKASPGAAIIKRDMLDYDYKVGQKILVRNEGILRKAQSMWQNDPWTITTVHTNGTITVQRGKKVERLNIRRVKPFVE